MGLRMPALEVEREMQEAWDLSQRQRLEELVVDMEDWEEFFREDRVPASRMMDFVRDIELIFETGNDVDWNPNDDIAREAYDLLYDKYHNLMTAISMGEEIDERQRMKKFLDEMQICEDEFKTDYRHSESKMTMLRDEVEFIFKRAGMVKPNDEDDIAWATYDSLREKYNNLIIEIDKKLDSDDLYDTDSSDSVDFMYGYGGH